MSKSMAEVPFSGNDGTHIPAFADLDAWRSRANACVEHFKTSISDAIRIAVNRAHHTKGKAYRKNKIRRIQSLYDRRAMPRTGDKSLLLILYRFFTIAIDWIKASTSTPEATPELV